MKPVVIRFFRLTLLGFGIFYFFSSLLIGQANPRPTTAGAVKQMTNEDNESSNGQRGERQTVLFSVQGNKDVRPLEVGKPIEREIAGGEVHTYEVPISAGQFLHVVVDEKGVNLVAKLFGLDRKLLIEVDTLFATSPVPEHVAWIAETSGTYRLEVFTHKKDASKKSYVISIQDLHDATAQDKVRVLAEQTLLEGIAIEAKDPTAPESLLAAAQKYEKAIELFKQVGSSDRMLKLLLQTGFNYATVTQYQKSLDYFNEALNLSRKLGDHKQEAAALMDIGAASIDLGEYQRAISIFMQVLPLEQALGISSRRTLINLGISNLYLGEYQKALEYFNKAEPLGASAKVICGIGTTYLYMGEYQTALEFLNRALETSRKTNNPYIEAESLMDIGETYLALGDLKSALKAFEEVLPLHRKLQDGAYEAATLRDIGEVHQALLDYRAALDYYNRALELARSGGYLGEEAEILPSVGDTYRLLGDSKKASEIYNQALHHSALDPNGEIKSLYGLASIALKERRLQDARTHIESATKVIESLRGNIANPQLRASLFATKQQPYLFYVDLLMQLHKESPAEGFDAQAFQLSEKLHARSLLDLLPEARANIRAGADAQLLARERSLQQLLNGKAERQIHLLNDKHTPEQAEEIKREIERIIADLGQTQAMIRASSPSYAALTHPQPLALKEVQQSVLDPDTLLLEYSLGAEHSYLWAVSPTAINSFVLPKRADIETAARRVYELLTARSPITKSESPKQQMARLARAETDVKEAAAALSRMVLTPAASLLGNHRLLIVADGILQYIPFAVLPAPAANSQPLIITHEIINLPSASVLAVLRKELSGRRPAAKAVAVLADPVFDKDDPRVKSAMKSQTDKAKEQAPSTGFQRALREFKIADDRGTISRLPFTREEAEAILAVAPAGGGMKALDFRASLATATSADLSGYRVVHFATHGLLNSEHPELSGLMLSLVDEQGLPQNGFLRLQDIYNLNLPVDLIVLSACNTALGKEIKGEGLVGLTRGFMYAGAKSVLASLWKVDDVATAELMKRLYQKMLKGGMKPAAALRAAQIEMWNQKQWQSPYYWGAFTLQGEWR